MNPPVLDTRRAEVVVGPGPAAPRPPRVADRPDWALPPGVTRALWDYAASDRLAAEEDAYFAGHPLFELDKSLLAEHVPDPAGGAVAVDLGCGTGRAILDLARRGYAGIAVDLSQAMLAVVARRAEAERLPVTCVRANLVELDGSADGSADVGLCLFSTLGMIRGRTSRRLALAQMRRVLRPTGRLVLHVHNQWHYVRLPGGLSDLARQARAALAGGRSAFGDRTHAYRGIPNVLIHSYTAGELRADLAAAGLAARAWLPLRPACDGLLTGWRRHDPTAAVGFWVVASPRKDRD